jgi:hypothetical protein
MTGLSILRKNFGIPEKNLNKFGVPRVRPPFDSPHWGEKSSAF